MPATVENAPPTVGTTSEFGPVGTVSMVFAGTTVEQGLFGTVDPAWLAISARSGTYRALSAPDLPEARAGAVAVSSSGDLLAWATGDGLQIYDPVTDETRDLPLEGARSVGHFSPDATMLTVNADGLRVVELASGDVVAEADGTPLAAPERAAWRPDSSAVDYVAGDRLVTLPADGDEPTTRPTPFAAAATLAWAPTGDTLVGLQDVGGTTRLLAATVADGGLLRDPVQVDTAGLSLQRLLGFSGDGTVAVSAFLLDSGPVERVLDVPLDGGTAVDVATLPSPGENWVGTRTLAVTEEALRAGSTDFGSVVWPWSHLARLVACALVGLFGLGLWLTRRPRRSRRRR